MGTLTYSLRALSAVRGVLVSRDEWRLLDHKWPLFFHLSWWHGCAHWKFIDRRFSKCVLLKHYVRTREMGAGGMESLVFCQMEIRNVRQEMVMKSKRVFQIRQSYVMLDVSSSSRGTVGWEATKSHFCFVRGRYLMPRRRCWGYAERPRLRNKTKGAGFPLFSTHIFFSYSAATGSEFLLRKCTPTDQKRKMPLLKGRRMQISILGTETLAELENPDTVGSTEGVGRQEGRLFRSRMKDVSITWFGGLNRCLSGCADTRNGFAFPRIHVNAKWVWQPAYIIQRWKGGEGIPRASHLARLALDLIESLCVNE